MHFLLNISRSGLPTKLLFPVRLASRTRIPETALKQKHRIQIPLQSILCTRLYYHLYQVADEDLYSEMTTVSRMWFASGRRNKDTDFFTTGVIDSDDGCSQGVVEVSA